ncbi:MAG: SdrD B-like domain-containing protein [Gemmatimonadota bacterium]
MRRRIGLLLLAVSVAATACEEEILSLAEGTPSTLSVRVYVDADGDGAFGAGDVPVSGVTVNLAGVAALSEATGADGLAAFSELAPGSYEASVSGSVPAGAVLSSGTQVSVAAPFQGAALEAEFRYAFQPGTVSGVVFRDDDMSGDFDPAQDTPAAGIPVALLAGAETVASTAADAAGAFSFAGVRPGSYTIVLTPFETIQIVGGNEIPVTVDAGGAIQAFVEFTGNLVIPIADARAAQGSVVTVEGVVTFAPSFDTRVIFFQDGTGGLSVFDFNLSTLAGRDLAVGDSIRMTGISGAFRGEVQIGSVSAVEILGTVAEPDPRSVTAAEINVGTFAGQLVTIDGTVLSVDTLSFGNQRVFLEDAAGDTFPVFGDSRTNVTTATWEAGQTYAVTGVLGTDDRDALAHRVEVRQPSDVVLGGSVISIADARGMDGVAVTVEGVVTFAPSFDDRAVFFQDATGGISVFDFDLATIAGAALQRGDRIRMRGTVSSFRSEVQLGNLSTVTVLGNEAPPAPRGVTGAEINAGTFAGQLVTITSGTVLSVDTLSFGNQLVLLEDAASDTFPVFGDSRTGVTTASWIAGEIYTVMGVLGTDDRDALPERIEVRDPADVTQTS